MGDSAWVTYQWHFSGVVDGHSSSFQGHTTLVLQKRTGNWLIVLNHTSVIPVAQPDNNSASSAALPADGVNLSPRTR